MPRTSPPSRSKALLGCAIVVVVIAAALVGGLVWHASTLEVSDGVRGEVDVVAIDGWATPSGFIVVSADSQARELVALAEDGEVLSRAPLGRHRLAQVSMAGDVVFLDDGSRLETRSGPSAITAVRSDEGRLEELWHQELTLEGSDEQMVELHVVAHAPSGETTIFGCAREAGSCWLVGLDPTGEELWRIEADDLRPAEPAGRPRDERPWLVPEELLVVRSPSAITDTENRPILAVDLATGDPEEVASGARVVTGRGFAVVSTIDDQGCGLTVLRDGTPSEPTQVPCDDDGAPRHSVVGSTVAFTSGEDVVLLDVDQGVTGTLPNDIWATWTGVGTAVAQDATPQLLTIDGELIVDVGSGWSTSGADWVNSSAGPDTLVVFRTHRSANPLATSPSTEVKVIDAADGTVCAHARLAGEPDASGQGRRYLPLSGCTALVQVGGTTHLLGR